MVDVKIYSGENSFIVTGNGHAGFAPKGQDIVCAGVSALCMALLNAVTYSVETVFVEALETRISDGSFFLGIKGISDPELLKAVRLFIYMFQTGMEKIEISYPENVNVRLFNLPERDDYNGTSEQTMNENERKEG